MDNILLREWDTLFGSIPFNKIETSDFLPAFDEAFAIGRVEIDNIINDGASPSFQNSVVALEKAGKKLSVLSSILFNLNHAHTSEAIQEIARQVSPRLTEFSNDIWMNGRLFERVKCVFDQKEQLNLRSDEMKLLEDTYKSFVRRGALLAGSVAERYRQVTIELSTLTLQFGENLLAETNDYHLYITNENELAGLPVDVISAASNLASAEKKEGWLFSLQFPSYLPFMKYSANRRLREEMYRAYSRRGNQGNAHDNNELVKKIVALRAEKARLLGFHSHADYVLEERMAGSKEKVLSFLNELLDASLPFARHDVSDVALIAKEDGVDVMQRWDFAYYSEKLKTERFNVNDEMTRPYFSLDKVEQGVFSLVNKLYGVTFHSLNHVDLYHPDVRVFQVDDENGDLLGLLYMDYFPRKTKQGGAWMTSFRDQHREAGVDIRPHISIVANFTPPSDNKPSLLTFNEVQTFLHEFGHALHGLMSKVEFESQSGTSVYRDFVELPSQIMENWALQTEWLNDVAVHWQTGEVIPDSLVNQLIAADLFQNGYACVRQLSFGLNDMAWHSVSDPVSVDVSLFEQSAMAATELFPPVEGSCMSTAFSHIFDGGYAAGYYGYKWAEVLDADAFESFKQKGVFNREVANSFRHSILEKGGSRHPTELYLEFKGTEPSLEPLLRRSGLIATR